MTHGTLVNKNSGVEIPGTLVHQNSTVLDVKIDGAESANGFFQGEGWAFTPDVKPLPTGSVMLLTSHYFPAVLISEKWFQTRSGGTGHAGDNIVEISEDEVRDRITARGGKFHSTTTGEEVAW